MPASLPMRKLAAILAADVVGFSRLMGADETGTLRRLSLARSEVIDPLIASHHGRIFKVMGDGLLVEFPSAVLALSCAIEIQNRLDAGNADLAPEERIVLRIGLHQGDVVVEGTDLLGDGVNVAARLEPLAEPGGICISDRVCEDAAGKLTLDLEDIGERHLKNIHRGVRVHRVRLAMKTRHPPPQYAAEPDRGAERGPAGGSARPTIAVLPFESLGGPADAHLHFASGLVEDVILALSRLRWLSVAPRNAMPGRVGDIRQAARALGVRYVVTGAVRQSGERVRVTAQVIEAATGEHVWADRHESVLTDVFEVQDRIAQLIAAGVVERLAPSGPPTRRLGGTGEDLQTVVVRGATVHGLSVEGVEPPRRVTIGVTPLTIGRVPPSQFLLTGGEVSRAHCRLNLAGEEVVVTDLGSTNGTFVDDRKIAAPTVLRHGARLRVGGHVLVYEKSTLDRGLGLPDLTGLEQTAGGGLTPDTTFRK